MAAHLPSLSKSKIRRISFLLILTVFNVFSLLFAAMRDDCDLKYDGDISGLKDSTIDVPDETVALSNKVIVDMPTDTPTIIGGTPSIFFIIDHSGSMYQNPGNDIDGKRFSVSLEFIDSIKAKFPSAEIGIAVFRQHLYFDPADSSYFVPLTAYPQGAYMPFFKLDSSYQNIGGTLGHIVVKNMLQTDTVGSYADMAYVPTNGASNAASTNINVGFAAAKHAFPNALYANNRQFIIFLSDGDATEYNGPNTSDMDFVTDVDGLPTTFTIFFTQSGTAPPNLVTMTNNIQNNGYSTNNRHSDIWAIDVANLLDVLMNEVMVIITGTIVGLPVDITVNGTTVSDYDTINNQFTFDTHFPLTGVKTDFEYKINYTIAKDSILPNGDTIVVVGDSMTEGNFSVVVDPSITTPPDWYAHTFEMICWQRDLQFYYNNANINIINEAMSPIELRFDFIPGDKDYEYTKADVEVITTQGLATDKETYTLSLSGTNSFRGTFPRVVIGSTQTPTQGNGIIEHYESDVFIATFRNNESPKLPLDTIRDTIPFDLSGTIRILCGYYYDNDANGFVDSIYVEVSTDISGGLTDNHVQEILDSVLTLPDFRDFTINNSGVVSGGFYIDVTEGLSYPTTYITSDDKLIVIQDILTTGGWIKDTIAPIYDRVAPIIHWAKKSAYLIDYQIDSMADTLGVKFSEPIGNITHEQPFYFMDISPNPDTIYTVMLGTVKQPSPDSVVFYVKSAGVMYMETGDSLWIHGIDRVGDTTGNFQNNSNNIRRKLLVERRMVPYDLNPMADSPLDLNNLNNHIIPDDIIDVFVNQGMFEDLNLIKNSSGNYIGMQISVKPDNIHFLLPDFRLKGYISISDDEGNNATKICRMAWDEKNKSLIWVWNIKDIGGAFAYTGVYLCLFQIEEITPSLGYSNGGPKCVKRMVVEVNSTSSTGSCGDCGTGTAFAFIPPIGFKIASILKRRKKWWYKFFKKIKAKLMR